MAIYETGIETSETLGSGSQFSNVFTTKSEQEALRAFHTGERNYLNRITVTSESITVEQWNPRERCWQSK